MQPKSQINYAYSAHKASTPGAQQLSLTSSTTLLRPCSLRVGSAQAIQLTGLSAQSLASQFDELDYSTQAMQPKSQISSSYSAHKASAPGAQQLSFTISTTLLRPCSLRVRSAQAIQPTGLSAQSPAAQFDELDYSTQAMQPKSQISSSYSSHKASAPGS